MAPILPDQQELVLTESRTMRAQTADRVDVLDKVKALALLPDGINATTEMVASYYEVGVEAIKSLVKDNRAELVNNGYWVLRGPQFREFVGSHEDLANAFDSKARSAAIFTRRTILNVGQLLTESDVARQVRTYLLEVEERTSPQQRSEAAEAIELAEARMRVLKAADGIVSPVWLETKARLVAARALGEEPDVDPLDVPLYVPDFLKSLGLKRKDVESAQSWFGRYAAAICAELGIELPQERQSDLPNGQVRKTKAWTERHRPVFELVWARHYAHKFPGLFDLGGAA
ncbi:hypothetical protein [Streptomyces sp. AMCC400023]|uniref:hypothetical protein n=1 Tax=Streptomyces sp. AMCC400023 TaxID=2056258 RepID=UPI001F28AB12|nr:hypothetical protein [Streptomyces sp. AMCC400023]UJV42014.1 hypothetical protein CVT30_21170 [Streptomyces sp. AMCC400023]